MVQRYEIQILLSLFLGFWHQQLDCDPLFTAILVWLQRLNSKEKDVVTEFFYQG